MLLAVVSVIYLIWYGWQVFVKDKGNPGGLGLLLSVFAWWNIASALIEYA